MLLQSLVFKDGERKDGGDITVMVLSALLSLTSCPWHSRSPRAGWRTPYSDMTDQENNNISSNPFAALFGSLADAKQFAAIQKEQLKQQSGK